MENSNKRILRTYGKMWKFEKKLYSIDNMRLPVPINPDEAVYFAVGLIITMGLIKLLPLLNGIPLLIRYLAIPYGLMKFLTKKKFDGKLPHRFLIGYIDYLGLPKKIARFQAAERYEKGYFMPIVYRKMEVVNITEKIAEKQKKKGGIRSCTNSQ